MVYEDIEKNARFFLIFFNNLPSELTWQWEEVAAGLIADLVFTVVEAEGVEVVAVGTVVELAASFVCCGSTTVITLNIEEAGGSWLHRDNHLLVERSPVGADISCPTGHEFQVRISLGRIVCGATTL
ncbi:hypothetical protein HNY73_015303 [Argiope bruennichi]|uniref:Uncharacterized protein n=1 Tax=Argiope bruennichi TaxID=94029 RepID=A0A8T0EX31_ARGBR|nr:hypothetical protein HNY73_015303 [Argiope bruennichi]